MSLLYFTDFNDISMGNESIFASFPLKRSNVRVSKRENSHTPDIPSAIKGECY